MDRSEAIARRHLEHLGYHDIQYEPDGNVPPDFLVDGQIAVEVRRLNQHAERAGKAQGLEKVQFQLLPRIRRILDSFGPPTRGASWFVTFRFQRPVDWDSVRPRLEAWLTTFRDGLQSSRQEISFGSNFWISVVKASAPAESLYLLGGFMDRDAGGWLLSKMEQNIALCSAEKAKKVARVRGKYPLWWLVLVDQIGYGLTQYEREIFLGRPRINHDWDRLIVVNPLDPMWAFELPSSGLKR